MPEETDPVLDDTNGRTPVQAPELLIDHYLATFDVTLIEHVVVDAEVATTWQSLLDLDLLTVHTPLMDAAMSIRGLPDRIATWRGQAPPPPELTELKLTGGDDRAEGLEGWLPLGQHAGSEIVMGAVGRFWQPDIEWFDVADMTPEDFAAFDRPGWGRIAAGFSLRPYGRTRTLLSYEARTATPDPSSRRRFARYWRLIQPFVGHIMRATLRSVADDAERRARHA